MSMLRPFAVIDRINRWTVKQRRRLRDEKRGKIIIRDGGIDIVKVTKVSTVKWSEIERITAIKTDVLIGDIISLTVLVPDGVTGDVSEHDPEWHDLIEAIHIHLPGSLPYANWALNLVAATTQTVLVYQAPSVPMIVRYDV